jgi:two-component sensor histidine kinase
LKLAAAIAWPVLGTAVALLDALLLWSVGAPVTFPLFVWGLVGWLEWSLLAPVVITLAERFPYRPGARRSFFLVHGVAPFLISAAHSGIYFSLRRLFFPEEVIAEVWVARLPLHLTLDFLVYSATVLATHVVLFLRSAWSREEARLALEKQIAQTELDMLRLQLPPDVIRQKLQALEAAIERDAMEAERQLMSFSAFLRERLGAPRIGSDGDSDETSRAVYDDAVAPPRPLTFPVLFLIVVGVVPCVLFVFQTVAVLRNVVLGRPIAWNVVRDSMWLASFSWPVTLLMVWLGSRVKRITVLAVAAAAAPPLWDLAFHTLRAGWPAARQYLILNGRTIDFLIFFGIALATLAWQRYLGWRRHAVEVAELDAVLLRSRSRVLRLQLNPHFLFNTLNSIAALLEDERDAAQRMAARLRHFVDRVLAMTDVQEVPLGEELALLSTYFDIENVRFGDRLHLDLHVGAGANGALVPSFLLQPLVENALRHGLKPSTGGRVSVSAAIEDEALRLEVLDNGQPRVSVVREGIGLSNTRARLRQLYGDSFAFDIERRDSGFRARLTIPFRRLITT